jgi:uncharacterized membrane protein
MSRLNLVLPGVLFIVLFPIATAQISAPAESSATITGTVFDGLTLEPLVNTVVTINTTPIQTKVSMDGTYSFEVPDGNYLLEATFSEQGIVLMEASQEVLIEGKGIFVLDLILLPEIDSLPDDPFPDDEPPPTIWDQLLEGPVFVWAIVTIMLLVIVFALLNVQKGTAVEKKDDKEEKRTEEATLDKYATEVLGILKRGGNRITQKELRSQISIGEAKVSLILSELEEYKLIKKIKKGRGNILILTEKGREFEQ